VSSALGKEPTAKGGKILINANFEELGEKIKHLRRRTVTLHVEGLKSLVNAVTGGVDLNGHKQYPRIEKWAMYPHMQTNWTRNSL